MNDHWHIPRATLASSAASSASSSGRSHKSHSNPPTVAENNLTTIYREPPQHSSHRMVGGKHSRSNHGGSVPTVHGTKSTKSGKSVNNNTRRDSEMSTTSAAATAAAAAAVLAAAAATKRGSRSSQGSSDSNNSTRSAASGSLLLTAANLERFAEIHKNQQKHTKLYLEDMAPNVHTTYNANLMHALNEPQQQHMSPSRESNHHSQQSHNSNTSNNADAIITLDPNLHFIKTKDLDSVSLASSMHFTMVNGDDGPARNYKHGLCDWGRQVTVLIVSMSTVFLLLIMGMVYALEMRARDMPQS